MIKRGLSIPAVALIYTFIASDPALAFEFKTGLEPLDDFVDQRGKDIENTGNDMKKGIDQTTDEVKKTLDEVGKGAEDAGKKLIEGGKKALSDTAENSKKLVDDIIAKSRKSLDDIAWNVVKGANDIVDAGKAGARYIEFQISGFGNSLSEADKRIREGKVVDAVWHLSTDPYKNQEEATARAAQESELVNTSLSAAASFYGGPAGASAYAAWYAYRSTGDVNMAVRVGVTTAIMSAGYSKVSAMPQGTLGQVTKKALVSGAVGGIAVAAAGGDETAVKDAFLKQGGMVIVQSGQSYVTKKYVDPAVAKADQYCMNSVGVKCSLVLPKYQRDAQGNLIFDAKGLPKIDKSFKLPGKETLGKWQEIAKQAEQDLYKKAPMVEQVFTKDKDWSISWNREALMDPSSNIPGVALTYTGSNSPYDEKIQELKLWAETAPTPVSPQTVQEFDKAQSKLAVKPTWTALHNIGSKTPFLDPVFPKKAAGQPLAPGDIARSNRKAFLRPGPAKWGGDPPTVDEGDLVTILEITTVTDDKGRQQQWARVEVIPSQ
ncbi:hypothetical protein KBI52_20890 [Microvirga sp. HBU67558]|uniref:hypothetical protein n=1 Tax=Microvirga TaxID=186650 RepID=UPI001B381402|nr:MULTISPECIES: hypothetical protein [unclassified Microvirga]MBQ0822647.1 hypothetical protein [Microvirga sp. HBU67558]